MEQRNFRLNHEVLERVVKSLQYNDGIIASANSKVRSIQTLVANFETSDMIAEDNPAFVELCSFFMSLDDRLIELDQILSNYRR